MSDSTRRNFLIASGAGAAVVGVAAAAPGLASAQTAPVEAAKPLTNHKNAQPLLAHVIDPSSGTLSLFLAEHEVIVHDPDLVARLTRAAGGEA